MTVRSASSAGARSALLCNRVTQSGRRTREAACRAAHAAHDGVLRHVNVHERAAARAEQRSAGLFVARGGHAGEAGAGWRAGVRKGRAASRCAQMRGRTQPVLRARAAGGWDAHVQVVRAQSEGMARESEAAERDANETARPCRVAERVCCFRRVSRRRGRGRPSLTGAAAPGPWRESRARQASTASSARCRRGSAAKGPQARRRHAGPPRLCRRLRRRPTARFVCTLTASTTCFTQV